MAPRTEAALRPSLIFLMALSIGAIVANLYYLQPLLHEVKSSFGISDQSTSLLISLIQVGYVVGLAFVVPLGDLVARRRLIPTIFVVAALSMALASFVHAFAAFAAATVVIGLCSVGGQVIIPFGADLSEPAQRGRTIGRLMTGLLSGILLSRTLSGALAEAVGWRGVYRVSAIILAVLALTLSRQLPHDVTRERPHYRAVLATPARLLATSALLRRRALLGACGFASFSVLWSTLAFELSGAPFHYSSGVIGLFGLFGLAGIAAANVAGHQADRARSGPVTVSAALGLVASFGLFWLGRSSLWLMILAIVVLDAAVQALSVTNQSIIYAIAPTQRSRINSAYMVCYFAGGVVGSLASGYAYAHHGWAGTCVVGLIVAVVATLSALAPAPSRTAPEASDDAVAV